MRLRALIFVLLTAGCGAKSSILLGPTPEPEPDAGVDAGRDASVDAGPGCGRGPACAIGAYCCSTDVCTAENTCCGHDDCPEGLACSGPGGVCAIGDLGCGLQELVPDVRPANVMLMLDRSESMYESIGGRTKWEIAASSLHEVLPRYAGTVRFGLTLFPGPITACQEGSLAYELADGNVPEILDTVDATQPGQGGTPIGATLEMLGGFGGLDDPAYANFILLLSDGSETCLGHPTTDAGDLYGQVPPIQVYPVGFGHRADQALLGDIARASHTESGTARGYWSAEDAAELTQAFDSILSSVIQCEFLLESAPLDFDRIYAFFDNTPVPRNRENGFDVDPNANRLTFYGGACTTVRTGGPHIRVVFGCPLVD